MNNGSGMWHNPEHLGQGFDITFLSETRGGLIWFNHSRGGLIHLSGNFKIGEWADLNITSGGSLFDDSLATASRVGYFRLDRQEIYGLRFTFDIPPAPDLLPEYGYDGIDLSPLFWGDSSIWRVPANQLQGFFLTEHMITRKIGGHYYGNTSEGGQDWLIVHGPDWGALSVSRRVPGKPFSYNAGEEYKVGELSMERGGVLHDDHSVVEAAVLTGNVGLQPINLILERVS